MKDKPAKRVNVVRVKVELVKETSILYKHRSIKSPEDAADLIRPFLEDMDREAFVVVCCLDTKNQMTSIHQATPTNIHFASIGSLNSSIVHPREIFKAAILSQASSIILFHNHPSGILAPSREDIEVTKRLIDAGNIIGIDILDHIIIGTSEDRSYYSFKEEGQM